MKKTLLLLHLMVFSMGLGWAQCVSTCSNYAMSPITFTTHPSGATNLINQFSPNTDDGVTPLIPLGFNFTFYCNSYNSVWICTNGFIQFYNGSPAISTGFADPTQAFPDPTNPNAMVALNMNDLDPGSGGTITYTTVGVSPNQKFIVTYSNVPVFGYPNSPHTGQIVLYETSNIIEIYTGNVTNFGITNGTQGIEDATGTMGMTVPGRNNVIWSGSNDAWQFAPYTPAPPSAITGPTNVCQGTLNQYQTVPQVGATSYTWTYPAGWNGPFNTTAVTAVAGSSGNLSVTATYTCGVSAAAVLNVSVTPAPVVSFVSVNPQILCSGYTFTVTPGGASTYTLLPGNITGTPPFVINADASTTYTLLGTDATGCNSFNFPTSAVLVNPSPTVTVMSGSICLGQTFSISPSGATSYNISGGFPNVTPGSAGVYTYAVTGVGQNSCISPVPVLSTVTVAANPVVNITASRSNLCTGETSILTASTANTYSWNTGATTSTIAVSASVTGTYNYTVVGTSPEGCSRSKSISLIAFPCTGIDEHVLSGAGLSVYPNPSSGLLHLSFESINANTALRLYDATGRLVLSRGVTETVSELDLSGMATGLYYLQVKNGDVLETVKVVKE